MRAMRDAGSALIVVLALVGTVLATTQAHAVCGDANGNGVVDDTDGVQVLRAAALLSSTCTPAVCDVNNDGQVDDTDGVLVLRKAVLLPVTMTCPSGGTEAEVKQLIETAVVPLIGYTAGGASIVSSSSQGARAAQAQAQSAPCTDGGTVEFNLDTDTITFTQCEEGGVLTDGTLHVSQNTLAFNLTIIDVATQETLHIGGSLIASTNAQGSAVVNGGVSFSSTSSGAFTLAFNALTFNVAQNGDVILLGGTVRLAEGSGSQDLGILRSLDLQFNVGSPDNVGVTATLDDGSVAQFNYNLVTAELTAV